MVPVAQGFLRGSVLGRLTQADAGAFGLFSAERTKDLNLDFSIPTKNMIDGAPEGLGQRMFYSHLRTYSNLEGGDYTENRIVFSTFYRF